MIYRDFLDRAIDLEPETIACVLFDKARGGWLVYTAPDDAPAAVLPFIEGYRLLDDMAEQTCEQPKV